MTGYKELEIFICFGVGAVEKSRDMHLNIPYQDIFPTLKLYVFLFTN